LNKKIPLLTTTDQLFYTIGYAAAKKKVDVG